MVTADSGRETAVACGAEADGSDLRTDWIRVVMKWGKQTPATLSEACTRIWGSSPGVGGGTPRLRAGSFKKKKTSRFCVEVDETGSVRGDICWRGHSAGLPLFLALFLLFQGFWFRWGTASPLAGDPGLASQHVSSPWHLMAFEMPIRAQIVQ